MGDSCQGALASFTPYEPHTSKRILLLDMSSYFAATEQQANPFLRGKPVIVSGDPAGRSVVSAASREAKKFGIDSGMSVIDAYKRCPQAVIVPLDSDRYLYMTDAILDVLLSYTDLVEPWSIDEMCMDIGGTISGRAGGEERLAREIKKRLQRKLGSWMKCSVGIAPNKMMAKIGSNLSKPDKILIIHPQDVISLLDTLKLTDIYGIGRQMKKRLSMIGIEDVQQLRMCSKEKLTQDFGIWGYTMYLRVRGIDSSHVSSFYDASYHTSVGHSITLPSDSDSPEIIFAALQKLSEKVARRLRKYKQQGRVIHAIVRYADFHTTGKQATLPRYTNDGQVIYRAARNTFEQHFMNRGTIRLVGVTVSSLLTREEQRSWIPEDNQRAALNAAADEINNRYGKFTVQPASLLRTRHFRKPHIDGFNYDRNR